MFAQLSGDFNPLHLDYEYARKTLFGKPIVHGIHQVFLSLETFAEKIRSPFFITELKADFINALGVGEVFTINCDIQDSAADCHVISENGSVLSKLNFSFKKEKTAQRGSSEMSFIKKDPMQPENMNVTDLFEKTDYNAQLFCEMFPLLSQNLSSFQIGVLLASTRIVGMKYPGLNSIYNGLFLSFDKNGKDFFYNVSKHPVLNAVTINIAADGVKGKIKACVRPQAVQQTPMKNLSHYHLEHCSSQRALIIGGSRGIGQQCLRLLGMSGAKTLFTYFSDKTDAELLQKEFSQNNLKTDFIQLDIGNVSKQALQKIQEFSPTHLYYFATPKISAGTGNLNEKRFIDFMRCYIFALDSFMESLNVTSLKNIFLPSSVAIDELPKDMLEYALAKSAMETYARWLSKSRKIFVYTPRFPRIATDQTQTILPIPAQKAEDVLKQELTLFLSKEDK